MTSFAPRPSRPTGMYGPPATPLNIPKSPPPATSSQTPASATSATKSVPPTPVYRSMCDIDEVPLPKSQGETAPPPPSHPPPPAPSSFPPVEPSITGTTSSASVTSASSSVKETPVLTPASSPETPPATLSQTRNDSAHEPDNGELTFKKFDLKPLSPREPITSIPEVPALESPPADSKPSVSSSMCDIPVDTAPKRNASAKKLRPDGLNRSESDRFHNSSKRLPELPPPSPMASTQASGDTTPTQKGLMKRVNSFLKRTNSRTGQQNGAMDGSSDHPVQGAGKSQPFAISSRSSATSRSVTPPSPGSPSSTIHENEGKGSFTKSRSPSSASQLTAPEDFGPHKHSRSASNIQRAASPRVGITWGPNFTEFGERMGDIPRRRRSISQDHVPKIRKPNQTLDEEDEDGPVELLPTFSFKSAEGVGMKARRLSTHLPDEFYVNSCELDEEYKSTSFVPGKRGQLVGKGATATVMLMVRRDDKSKPPKPFAAKEFRRREKDEDALDYVKKVKSEFSIANSLHHPNMVETVRLCHHRDRWYHIMEYCQQGELYSFVEKGLFRTHFKLNDRLCLFKQLIRGMDYLHGHGIAHRDIKLENLLLTSEGHLKITDFGVSEVFCGEHPGLRDTGGLCGQNMNGEVRRCQPGICGSLPYIAPEILDKRGDYDPRKSDVWSCAIVYLTMTYGGSPWGSARPTDQQFTRFTTGYDNWLQKNPEGQIHDGPGGTPQCGPLFHAERLGSPAIKRMMLKMLNPNPDKRILISDVLNSSYMKSIECCTPESYEDAEYAVDATTGKCCNKSGAKVSKTIQRKHNHLPPKEHKTPKLFQHRFDMGDGYS